MVLRVLHESLIPMDYPPVKAKATAATSSRSQRSQRNQDRTEDELTEGKIDKIRAERLLVLVHGLEEKAKNALINRFKSQKKFALILEKFLKCCEDYNVGSR